MLRRKSYNLAFSGKMGSGKSTAADSLVRSFGYRQLSFAAPLKALVIEADPLVTYTCVPGHGTKVHLSDLLASGKTFEECKREYPEVRRSLQRIGQGARKIDPDFWVRQLLDKLTFGVPCVIADVRYPNEVQALEQSGFRVVRIERPGAPEDTRAAMHESETALDRFEFSHTIVNDGTAGDLLLKVWALAQD